MEFNNPRYNSTGGIDMDINHPKFGWVPTTAREDDQETQELYWQAKEGYVAPYVEPSQEEVLETWRDQATASAYQIHQAFEELGLYDEIEQVVASQEVSNSTRIAWNMAPSFDRRGKTIAEIAEAIWLTDEQVDSVFRIAQEIV